ncbi:hypothetical protein ILYODFUR_011445, partial [Ilyodon furcidens]
TGHHGSQPEMMSSLGLGSVSASAGGVQVTKDGAPAASSFRFVTNVGFFLLQTLCWRRADMPLAKDLLHRSPEEEKRRHKKKRLVQSPNSYFMDVKCPGCYKITTVFSHAQTVVLCVGCSTVLCQPTGGKARLTEGCSFRRKQH